MHDPACSVTKAAEAAAEAAAPGGEISETPNGIKTTDDDGEVLELKTWLIILIIVVGCVIVIAAAAIVCVMSKRSKASKVQKVAVQIETLG